jgi:hypothetical protein
VDSQTAPWEAEINLEFRASVVVAVDGRKFYTVDRNFQMEMRPVRRSLIRLFWRIAERRGEIETKGESAGPDETRGQGMTVTTPLIIFS